MYQIHLTPDAEADLARLEAPMAERLLKKLRWFAENFETMVPEALTGQWRGAFKLRVGDYRILYTYRRETETITVHVVGHRRDIYE